MKVILITLTFVTFQLYSQSDFDKVLKTGEILVNGLSFFKGGKQSTWLDYDDLPPTMKRAAITSLDPVFFDRRGVTASKLGVAFQSLTTAERTLYLPSPISVRVARLVYGQR